MNSKNIGIIVFIVLLALVIVFNRGDVTLVQQNNFTLSPISANGYVLQSEIHLNNPNILSCTVKSIHEKFSVNGKVLGILDQEINQGIPGRKESIFPVNIRFSKQDYYAAAGSDSTQPNNVTIKVEGKIEFTKVIGGGEIEIHETQAMPVLP
jgi:LEA14-like dessication related protein